MYFGLVFGAGFVLGSVRVLWLAPRVGQRAAELLEMPLMFVLIVLSARWAVRRWRIPPAFRARLGVGCVALGLLLVAEWMVLHWVRESTPEQYLANRDPVAGAVYLLMLGLLAVVPVLVARR